MFTTNRIGMFVYDHNRLSKIIFGKKVIARFYSRKYFYKIPAFLWF